MKGRSRAPFFQPRFTMDSHEAEAPLQNQVDQDFHRRKARHAKLFQARWEQLQAWRARRDQEKAQDEKPLRQHDEAQWIWRPRPQEASPLAREAFGATPQWAGLAEKALDMGAVDIHLESRASGASIRFRVDGEMREALPLLHKDQLLAELGELCSVDGAALENESRGGMLRASAKQWTFQGRMQSVPVYPEGFDLIVRLFAQPILNEQQERALKAWEEERKSILDRLKCRREEREREWAADFERLGPQGLDAQLIQACARADASAAERLLSQGANPNAEIWQVHHGEARVKFPLAMAAVSEKNAPKMIRALLAAGADPDQVDQRGATALILAASAGAWDACQALLQASLADAQDFEGESALARAAQGDSKRLVELLAGASRVDLGCFEFHGQGPDRQEALPKLTALHRAVEAENLGLCKTLIGAGADPRKIDFDEDYLDSRLAKELRASARRLDERDALEKAALASGLSQSAPRL